MLGRVRELEGKLVTVGAYILLPLNGYHCGKKSIFVGINVERNKTKRSVVSAAHFENAGNSR